MQHLKDSDTESRLHLAHWMKENDQMADVICFSGEAHFHLNAQINKKKKKKKKKNKKKQNSILGKREARFVPGKTFTWQKGYSVGGNEFCWDHRAFRFLKMNREMLRL